jgi:hypothetical protein
MKLRWVAPRIWKVYPGRAVRSTVRHPPKVMSFSASNQAMSGSHPGLHRIFSGYGELTMGSQDLQGRAVEPSGSDLGPHCAIQVHRGSAPGIVPAPLQRCGTPE